MMDECFTKVKKWRVGRFRNKFILLKPTNPSVLV